LHLRVFRGRRVREDGLTRDRRADRLTCLHHVDERAGPEFDKSSEAASI